MWRAVSLTIFLLARFAASTSVVSTKQLRQKHAGASFISSLQFKLVLRVCNAYPYSYPMDIYLGKQKLTDSPMHYKTCGEFAPQLKVGDKLDFKVGESSAGSFTVSELPNNDATMVLVIFRHDVRSTAVSFESHVFSNLLNAQIAVLDTYRGAAKSSPKIQDKHQGKDKVQRSEELRYNSVVAINSGLYEVVLHGENEKVKAQHELVALNRESYLVMRVGVEAEEGEKFPEELMVFPQSDVAALGGAAKHSLMAAAGAIVFSLLTALA